MDENSSPSRFSGKIRQFIRKNKTLSLVLGAGGAYFTYKELKKNHEPSVEGEVVPGSYEGPSYPTSELSHEGVDEEINRIDEENRDRERQQEEEKLFEEENKNQGEEKSEEGNSKTPGEESENGNEDVTQIPEVTTPPEVVAGGSSITIHGKTFVGATSSRVAKTGETEGGKKFIEYAINFPGRQEHWQYFTATGNWRQVSNSAGNGPTQGGKSGEGNNSGNPGGGGGGNGGSGGGAKPPEHNPSHPDAKNTGNPCVNGGIGGHTAPPGYHLFCENGWIWRAPDPVGVGPGRPVAPPPAPTPAPPPAPPSCPQGTRDNINHARDEINRLQGEINGLQNHISQLTNVIQEHPNAKQRGQWEAERNADRANIDNKRGNISQYQQVIDNGHSQPGCAGV